MKITFSILFIIITATCFAQDDFALQYEKASVLLEQDKTHEAFSILHGLETALSDKDSLYLDVIWDLSYCYAMLEKEYRMKEDFENALQYSIPGLEHIQKCKKYFDETYAKREVWMQKNIIVSYFGLGDFEKAKEHQSILYQGYKDKTLPDGIDEYYNFVFFKFEDKNIWGYEWYEELPKDRFSTSFSKIVFYVYSTNLDGTDKDQLYRLHVLMFHKIDPEIEFDYVLTKRVETAKKETSGTLYAYTYKENIDYEKLLNDVREVLKGNLDGKKDE